MNKHISTLVMAALALALSACAPQEEPDQTSDRDQAETTVASQTYRGIQSDALGPHTASFYAEFAPADGSPGWVYDVALIQHEAGVTEQRTLRMNGLPSNVDPGDVTLIATGGRQYMIGEGVGASRCLLFPDTVDLDDSFLTPDDFLAPISVPDSALEESGTETVANQEGTLYILKNPALGNFTNTAGSIVVTDSGAVLRHTIAADTVDNILMDGVAGRIKWTYQVTEIGTSTPINVPAECVVDLPVMDDAEQLSRLPNLIEYETAHTLEEIQAFYETELAALGWSVYEFPQAREGATVLAFAKEGAVLNVSVEEEAGKRTVQLFTEDR